MLSQHFGAAHCFVSLGGCEGRFLVGTIKKLKCHEKTSWTWEIYLFRSSNNIWKNNLHKGGRLWPSKSVPLPIKGQLWFFIPKINKYPSPEKQQKIWGIATSQSWTLWLSWMQKKYPSTENPSPRFSDHYIYMVSWTHTIQLCHSHILSRDSNGEW